MEKQTLKPLYRSDALKDVAGEVTGEGLPDSLTVGCFPNFLRSRRALLSHPVSPEDLHWAREEMQRPRSLLAFAYEATALDGSLAVVSFGYISGYDVPPWDTWVHLEYTDGKNWDDNILICWVPEWAGDLMDETVWMSVEGCFTWLKFEDGRLLPKGWQERWQD